MEKSATHWMTEPLRRYAQFSGRARRKEYWWFVLFSYLISFALALVDIMIVGADTVVEYGIGPLSGIAALVLLIPSTAVSFRRLHDHDRSAWWLLLGILPIIGALVLLVWFCQRGTIGDNRFGPDPIAER